MILRSGQDITNGCLGGEISFEIEPKPDPPNMQRQTAELREEPLSSDSVLPGGQKLWISLLASFAGMFSTLCSYIYYPALVPVADDLGVSITLINLTITSYLVVAAVAPAFMGDMADQSGRRPIYMLMFVLFIGANAGIALQKSFAAMLVLRMLQSAGSSGRENCLFLCTITEGLVSWIRELIANRAHCCGLRGYCRYYSAERTGRLLWNF